MRVYGRVPITTSLNGVESSDEVSYPNYRWVVVETDAAGFNDYVYITALIQCLRLNLNESPFWARFGVPAQNSVIQQAQPDFYIAYIQNYFSQFFASLIIAKRPQKPNDKTPTYDVSIVRLNGSVFQTNVGI